MPKPVRPVGPLTTQVATPFFCTSASVPALAVPAAAAIAMTVPTANSFVVFISNLACAELRFLEVSGLRWFPPRPDLLPIFNMPFPGATRLARRLAQQKGPSMSDCQPKDHRRRGTLRRRSEPDFGFDNRPAQT